MGKFTINAEFSHKNTVFMELFNSLGQKIYEQDLGSHSNLKSNIEIEGLTKGVYILKISSNNDYVTVKLLVN
jgi:hypothetical protein